MAAAILARCELFFSHLSTRDRVSIDNSEEWGKTGDMLASDQSALRAIYALLPTTFAKSLGFKQFTIAQ